MTLEPPPIIHPLANDDGLAELPWVLFFNNQFKGDQGTAWTPVFTNLTAVGTPTIRGTYYRMGPIYFFSIVVTPGTSTTATAGTTYCDFPIDVTADGTCWAVSGLLGSSSGMVEASTNRIYVPSWSAVTVPLTVLGLALGN